MVLPLEKYKDCKRLLNIFKKYTSANTLTTALNKGLKDIGCVISPQLPDLTFYAARHTWATIAENNAGLSTSLVDRCLNHTDSKLKMARTYIKTDWRPINKANRAVLDFFANGTDEDSMDF